MGPRGMCTQPHPPAHGMSTPCMSLRLPHSLYQPAHSSEDTGSLLQQRVGGDVHIHGHARACIHASQAPAQAATIRGQPSGDKQQATTLLCCTAAQLQQATIHPGQHSAHVIMPRMTRERSMREMRCSWMSCRSTPCSAALWSTDTWGQGTGEWGVAHETFRAALLRGGGLVGHVMAAAHDANPQQHQPLCNPSRPSSHAQAQASLPYLHHRSIRVICLDHAIAEHQAPGRVLPVLLAGPEVNQLRLGSRAGVTDGALPRPRRTAVQGSTVLCWCMRDRLLSAAAPRITA